MSDKPLPAPLLPPTVDLRDYEWMPLDVVRLRDSKTVTKVRAEEFRAAVMLWCASWHQMPAASLPDDEEELTKLAGYGIAVREWRKVRAGAMRGFIMCSDGRYYHQVIAQKAISSWIAKLEQKHRSVCGTLRKWNQRHPDEKIDVPTFQLWITRAYPESVPLLSLGQGINVSGDIPPMSSGQPPDVPDLFAPDEKRGEEIQSLKQHQRLQASAASQAVDNPRPEAERQPRRPKPGTTAWEQWLAAEGRRKGLTPSTGESWTAFEARVRTAKAA